MRIKNFECGMIDYLPSSFKEYLLTNNISENICNLKKNLDENSLDVVNSSLKKILHLPDAKYKNVFFYDEEELNKNFADSRSCYNSLMTIERYQYFMENYKFPYPSYDAEVLIFHHSLSDRSDKFKEYLQGKIFIDGGAYIGESVLVMLPYNPSKIFSFEISDTNIKNYLLTMQMNNVSCDKFELVKKGLSNVSCQKKIRDLHYEGVSEYIGSSDDADLVDFVSLDDFYFNDIPEREREREREKEIGFIKADIEGSMISGLQGMEKIIKKFRPVCSFAIYHSPFEFFETKPLLEEYTKDLNYSFEIHNKVSFPDNIWGVTLFAYPTEIN